jgi:hypothetical protein
MRIRFLIPCLVVLAVAASACDTSGIHALGRRRDALVPCDVYTLGRLETTSTWLRSTDEGTEIFLLGRADATTTVDAASPACYGHGLIAHDSTTHFEFGSYSLDATGKGFAVHNLAYDFKYDPDTSILGRDGSLRQDLKTPVSEPLTIAADGSQIILSLSGDARRLTALGEVVESVDVHTQKGAEATFTLFSLPMLTSQVRLLGFGGGSMTQYVDQTATFGGLIRNKFTVSVESWLSPNTLISYYQLEDLSGIVIDGPQKTNVDTSGNGQMDGVLNFIMRGTGGVSDVAIRGHLDYAGLQIRNGIAAGGQYALTIDGIVTPYVISYELAANVDLRDVLPVEAP